MNVTARPRLLIVDDEVAQMTALCNTLEDQGYVTTGLTSANQALAVLRGQEFDLVLTDLMMPEMDGIALLRAALEMDANLVGIVMTGHGSIDTAVEAMQGGALDYIQKPFKLSVIVPVVARALGVRRLRIENAELERRVREHAAELAAANQERDKFFDTSLDMLCIAKSDGYFKRLNPSFTETLGWSMEELLERPFIDFVHSDDRDSTLREVEKQNLGEAVLNFENRYQHKDGSWRWLSWRSGSLRDGLMYATARDVTQQRQTQADLLERTSQLEAANKELEAFSYSVSHDLRSPLRTIDGFSKAVLEDYGAQLPPEAQRHLQFVREGAQQMGALIDDLLTFSRLSRQPLDRRTLDTARLVNQSLDELRPQQQGRQIELRMVELPPCRGDPSLLKQVWINLLSNALKYSSKRETAIIEVGAVPAPVSGASVDAPPAAGTAASTNHEIAYFVRDNGVGFDMRYAHKLFGVFQRLHRAEDYDGTGVGLAIVHRIIHRHGGRVWAEAAVDRGATFYFTLEGTNT